MRTYLSGYLDVIPSYQKQKITDFINSQKIDLQIENLAEEEFKELVVNLSQSGETLSEMFEQGERLDPDLHNEFMSNAYIDLLVGFVNHIAIEKAVYNYQRIFDGILYDIQQEYLKLKDSVEAVDLKKKTESNIITTKISFESSSDMENYENNKNLFTDRDGSLLTPINFDRRHDLYYVCLDKSLKQSALRDSQNKTTAKIKIDARTSSYYENPSIYGVENSIDNSKDTYFGEIILANEEINIEFKKVGRY